MEDPRSNHLLLDALCQHKNLVLKDYLNSLKDFCVCPPPTCPHILSLFKIQVLPSSTTSFFFTFVLNALGNLKDVFGYILQSSSQGIQFYIGLKSMTSDSLTSLQLLKNGLTNTFPSIQFCELSPKESSQLLKEWFNPLTLEALSCSIVIPDNTTSTNTPINQKLLDLLKQEEFLALFLAIPFNSCEIKCLIKELQDLFQTLSSFSQTAFTFSHNQSTTISLTRSNSTAKAKGSSRTCTKGLSKAHNVSSYSLTTPSTSLPLTSSRSINISMCRNQAQGCSHTDNDSLAENESENNTLTTGTTHQKNTQNTKNEGIAFTNQNKIVSDALAKINALISRLMAVSEGPMFCFSSYFLSSCKATSLQAAYTYTGLAKDTIANVQDSFVITWTKEDACFPILLETLESFSPLYFNAPHCSTPITSSTLITSLELLNSFYFPYSLVEIPTLAPS